MIVSPTPAFSGPANSTFSNANVKSVTIQRFDAGKAPLPALHIEGLTHSFGPVEAVELARALGMLPPRLILYAIEGARYDNNVPPSPAVRRAAQQVAECIRGECLALQPEALK